MAYPPKPNPPRTSSPLGQAEGGSADGGTATPDAASSSSAEPGDDSSPAAVSTACHACTITSETKVKQPKNRSRTTIGVGERVTIRFSCGPATWSLSGPGRLFTPTAGSVVYRSPARTGTATITATGSGTCTGSITFTIIEPASVTMRRNGAREHTQNRPDIGMFTHIWIGPDTVNFYNIQCHEVDVPCTATGVYALFNGLGHDAHPATLSMRTDVLAGRGTRVFAVDHVNSGDPGTPAPFAPGHELYHIPWGFRAFGGAFKHIDTANQVCRLAADAVSLTAAKAHAHADCKVGDA